MKRFGAGIVTKETYIDDKRDLHLKRKIRFGACVIKSIIEGIQVSFAGLFLHIKVSFASLFLYLEVFFGRSLCFYVNQLEMTRLGACMIKNIIEGIDVSFASLFLHIKVTFAGLFEHTDVSFAINVGLLCQHAHYRHYNRESEDVSSESLFDDVHVSFAKYVSFASKTYVLSITCKLDVFTLCHFQKRRIYSLSFSNETYLLSIMFSWCIQR